MWKHLIFILLLLPGGALGENKGIFRALDQQYEDSVWDLPELSNINPDIVMTPDNRWFNEHCTGDSTVNCVFGWLDIVGFRQSVRIGDIYYINTTPESAAMVQYQTYVRINGRYMLGGWKYDLQTYREGDNIVAHLTATAILYQIDQSGYKSYANETGHFYDTEPAPQVYDLRLKDNFTIMITEYNNTISPKVSISVPSQGNATVVTVKYRNATARHRNRIGAVSYTTKNVPYLDMASAEYWNLSWAPGHRLYRIGNQVLVNGTTLDYSALNVSASTPFSTVYSQNYSIHRIDYSPEKTWNPVFFMVLGFVGIFGYGIKQFWKMI